MFFNKIWQLLASRQRKMIDKGDCCHCFEKRLNREPVTVSDSKAARAVSVSAAGNADISFLVLYHPVFKES